jgi:type II secretory pathway pseudopilin PulG
MKRRTPPARTASGFSLVELVVVVAAIVLLSAVITPQIFSWIEDSKMARAASDSAAVGAAMSRFFQDTKRWPGQVEILESGSPTRFLTVGDPIPTTFPALSGSIGITTATCVDGLAGVEPKVTNFASATPSAANTMNVTDMLLAPPSAADYPNWKGPYLSVDVSGDPWEKVYVINVIPLFCGETVTASNPSGALGYGWVISGGPNGTIQTPFTSTTPAEGSDDVGVTLSKRSVQGTS